MALIFSAVMYNPRDQVEEMKFFSFIHHHQNCLKTSVEYPMCAFT